MRGITNPVLVAPTCQVLEVDGVPLAESYAILMYAGRLAKLVPEDAFKAAQVCDQRADQAPRHQGVTAS